MASYEGYRPFGADKDGNVPVRVREAFVTTKEFKEGVVDSTPMMLPGYYEGNIPVEFGLPSELSDLYPAISVGRDGKIKSTVGVSAKSLFAKFSSAYSNPTQTYYLSGSGNDSNSGSLTSPLRTIKAAITKANSERSGNSTAMFVFDSDYDDDSWTLRYGAAFGGVVHPQLDTAWVVKNKDKRVKIGPRIPLEVARPNYAASNIAVDPTASDPANFSGGGSSGSTISAGPALSGADSQKSARMTVNTTGTVARMGLGTTLGTSFPNSGQLVRVKFKAKFSDPATEFIVSVRTGAAVGSTEIRIRDVGKPVDSSVREYSFEFNTFRNVTLSSSAGIFLSVTQAGAVAGRTVDVTDVNLQILWADGGPTTDPSKDSVYTNTVRVPAQFVPNDPIRVLDRYRTDADGTFEDLVHVNTVTECNNTPGSWFWDRNNLHINRKDGSPASDKNTLVTAHIVNMMFESQRSMYFENIDFIGGSGDVGQVGVKVQSPTNTPKAIITENCTFQYSGGDVTPGGGSGKNCNSAATLGHVGLLAHFYAKAFGSAADVFNIHRGGGDANLGWYLMLTVGCVAFSAGTNGNSRNLYTLHENCKGIDIGSDFSRGHGGNVHNVNSSKFYGLGTLSGFDYGDLALPFTGDISPTLFKNGDTSISWLERCMAIGFPGSYAYDAASSAKIFTRDCVGTSLPTRGPVYEWV